MNDNKPDGDKVAKLVVLALKSDEERQAFSDMLLGMAVEFKQADSAIDALALLEDHTSDLFIMDIDLPDMHAWQMLSKVREIDRLRDLPIVVIADHHQLANTITKVSYLTRPISISRLRHIVQAALD